MRLSAAGIRLNPRALTLLIVQFTHVLGQSDTVSPPSRDATATRVSSSSSEPTCESRTVNYITHTLPQQCLTSSPSPLSNPESVSATATSTTTASATTSADGSSTATDDAEAGEDGDDDLSTGAFMSFEEWKAMMAAKSDQEALDAKPRKRQDRQPPGDFDALGGEDGEISLDFDAYSDKISEITAGTRPSSQDKDKEEKADLATTYDEDLAVYRSKDAGKTCKERFSYSSFDAGATTLKTSPGTKNPTAILGESKDSYMLMECATRNKFFIVELSDVILVDTVVLANYEFFSSMIRQFRVSVSDRYPVKLDKWTVLGTFEARNARDIQAFLVENPRIWARYLRVEILNHYGNEYYCPLSLLRVHGMRMLDSLRAVDPAELEGEEEASKTPVEDAEEAEETEEIAVEDRKEEENENENEEEEEDEDEEEETHVAEPAPIDLPMVQPKQSEWMAYWDPSYFQYMFLPNSTSLATDSPYSSISPEEVSEQSAAAAKPRPPRTPEQTSGITSNVSTEATSQLTESPTSDLSGAGATTPSKETPADSVTTNTTEVNSTSASSLSITSSGHVNDSATAPSNNDTPPISTQSSLSGRTVSKNSKTVAPTSVVKPPASKPTASKGAPPPPGSSSSGSSPPTSRSSNTNTNTNNNNEKPTSSTGTNSNSTSTSTATSASSSPPAPSPTVQDSFFKTLTKRLQTLESNTTLSLQYIEQQSQFLRSALARLERRQVSRVDAFLGELNRTVLVELRDARSQCDAIWQSTVIALESQREQAERELVALGERLGVLADEVVFQKRMAIAQSALLLVCLVLVIFSSRGGGGGGGGMGVMGGGFSESYYPSQFLAASPTFFPSTPRGEKAGGINTKDNSPENRGNSGPMISIDSPPTSAPPTGGAFPYGRFPDSWPRARYRQSPSQTLLEIARRQAMPHQQQQGRGRGLGWGRGYGRSSSSGSGFVAMSPPSDNDHDRDDDDDDNNNNDIDDATMDSSGSRRPSPTRRAATAPPPDYYEHERQRRQQQQGQGQDGGDQNTDVGYDSEPATTPNRRGDYFQATAATSNVNNEVVPGGSRASSGVVDESTPPRAPSSSYTEVLARKVAERQLTPSSSSASDGETDYLPRSSRPPLSHAGSARTTLPVLPEDAD